MAVLISGGTGFIAEWIISLLLEENYNIITTVRSEQKADNLHRKFGRPSNLTFEIVKDISDPLAFDPVFEKRGKEIDVVLHVASPFTTDTTRYVEDLLVPAVNGTRGILDSIKKYSAQTVERVVITSSFAAILDISKFDDPNAVFTEKDWNPATWEGCQTDGMNAYCASKKFAEEAAWKFLEQNRNAVRFNLTTVNPTFVFGPHRFEEDVKPHLNTSSEMINSLLHTAPGSKDVPQYMGGSIDVRDVAKAHLLAFQRGNTIGERLGLSNEQFSSQNIIDILFEEFPQLKGKISPGPEPGKGDDTNQGVVFDNSHSKKILDFPFISLKKSVYDTAFQILKKEGRL